MDTIEREASCNIKMSKKYREISLRSSHFNLLKGIKFKEKNNLSRYFDNQLSALWMDASKWQVLFLSFVATFENKFADRT